MKLFPTTDAPDLAMLVGEAHRLGACVAIHATSESEVEAAIGAIERHRSDYIVDRIEHATLLSAEQAERIAAARAVIVTHPGWLVTRSVKYAEQLRPEQRSRLIPLRTAIDRGCRIAFGSDAPVELPDPQLWLRAATQREGNEAISFSAAWEAACGGPLWESDAGRG